MATNHKKNLNDHLITLIDDVKSTITTTNKNNQHNLNIPLNSVLATAALADSTGEVGYDTANDGWSWTNEEAGQKLNLYFYSGTNDNKTLADLEEINFSMVNYAVSRPFVIIYTKPTGTNDHGVFYHSRIYYKTSDDYVVGKTHYTFGDDSHLNLNNTPKKPMTRWLVNGEAKSTEEILFITLQTDSGQNVNNYVFSLDHFGYKFKNDDMVSIKLANEVVEASDPIDLTTLENSVANIETAINNEASQTRDVNVANTVSTTNTYDEANASNIDLIKTAVLNNVPVAISNESVAITNSDITELNTKTLVPLRTLREQGKCYLSSHNVSGNNSTKEVYFYNNVSSGKTLYIYQVLSSFTSSTSNTNMLMTLLSSNEASGVLPLLGKIHNLKLGEADNSGLSVYEDPTITSVVEMEQIRMISQGSSQIIDFYEEMLEVPQGYGLLVRFFAPHSFYANVSVRFYDEAIVVEGGGGDLGGGKGGGL